MALLLDDSQPLPDGWRTERVAIYRNAYRARVVDAIGETYPRTRRWVGDGAFRRAAVHHVIEHPPQSWNLDAVGEGMPGTLAGLFANDPEVAELAWLEWALHACFVSADGAPMDIEGFRAATAAFGDADWEALRLRFVPGTRVASVGNRVDTLWRALSDDSAMPDPTMIDYIAAKPLACAVWREGLAPVCAPLCASEGYALALMLEGASYGETCARLVFELGEDTALREAGAMLGRWIHNGMVVAVERVDDVTQQKPALMAGESPVPPRASGVDFSLAGRRFWS